MANPAPQPNEAVKAAYEKFVREYRSSRPAEQIFSDEKLFPNGTLTAFSRYMSSMLAYYKDHPQDARENESNYKTVMYLVPVLKNEEVRRKTAMSKNPAFYVSSYVECYLPNLRRAVPA